MTPMNFLLCLLCLFSYKDAVMTCPSPPDYQHSSVISAQVGQTITLKCCDGKIESNIVFWYKLILGQIPKLIVTLVHYEKRKTFSDEFTNSRFTLDHDVDHNNLTIAELKPSDSGVYVCVIWKYRELKFTESITVSVRAAEFNGPTVVHQPEFENFHPGGSVNLSCTVHPGSCDGAHSVYWFLSSEEHQPELLYTNGGRGDQCEKKSNTETHTCFYNLPLNSNSGTYYCAVASCGQILFGNGTRLESKDRVNLVHFMYVAFTFTAILSLCLSALLLKRNKEKGSSTIFGTKSDPHENTLYFITMLEMQRTAREFDSTWTDCIYSSFK